VFDFSTTSHSLTEIAKVKKTGNVKLSERFQNTNKSEKFTRQFASCDNIKVDYGDS